MKNVNINLNFISTRNKMNSFFLLSYITMK